MIYRAFCNPSLYFFDQSPIVFAGSSSLMGNMSVAKIIVAKNAFLKIIFVEWWSYLLSFSPQLCWCSDKDGLQAARSARVLMMIAVIRWSRLARLIIYCWGRGHPPTTRLGIWVNQSCAARSRAHNRMVIIRGVITCESAGNNNMLARGCVRRFDFFGLLHWWSAGWMGGLGRGH